MTQFPKSLLITLAILLVLLVGLGIYSVRKLGGAYSHNSNTIIDSQ